MIFEIKSPLNNYKWIDFILKGHTGCPFENQHRDFHCKVWLQTVGQEQRSFDTVCHFMTDHSISRTNYVTSQCLNFFIHEMKMILAIYLLIYLTKLL